MLGMTARTTHPEQTAAVISCLVLLLISGAYAKSSGISFGFTSLWTDTGNAVRPLAILHLALALLSCIVSFFVLISRLGSENPGKVLPPVLAFGLLAASFCSRGITFTGAGFNLVPPLHAVLGIVGIGVFSAVVAAPHGAESAEPSDARGIALFRIVAGALLIATTIQVTLGALVRHFGAGLSIPDFPLAMGQVIPPLSSPFVAVHFAHRVVGMVVVTLALVTSGVASIDLGEFRILGQLARGLAALVSLQVVLGAYVIWWQRDVAITTAHVIVGAAVFALAMSLWLRAPGKHVAM